MSFTLTLPTPLKTKLHIVCSINPKTCSTKQRVCFLWEGNIQ